MRARAAAASGLTGLGLACPTFTGAKAIGVAISRTGAAALIGYRGVVARAAASGPVSIFPGPSLGGTSGECRHRAQDDNFLFHSGTVC